MENPIKLVDRLIAEAAQKNASDLHFEPQKDHLIIRVRLDGMLREKEKLAKTSESSIISRLKIMAGLDIAEKRIGQDGRINFPFEGRELDLRISTVPTIFGEKVVVRILAWQKQLLTLKELGFEQNLKLLSELIRKPNGLILVTGPTGSGKTTTLYAILKEIATPEKNVITLEEPVEYILTGVNQIQINPKAGLNFSNGLRWVLRQDPDIIMVGEIRDIETARLALSAALTGHLVFATLHTTSAKETIIRLTQMGLEPFLVAPALAGIISQRLVRIVCPECGQKKPASESEKNFFQQISLAPPETLIKAKGCPGCEFSGYRGRTGIFEVAKITEKIKESILNNPHSLYLGQAIAAEGFLSLHQAGLKKVSCELTTLEEIERVVSLN